MKGFLILYNLESELVILQQILHHQGCCLFCFLMALQPSTAGGFLAALQEEWARSSLGMLLRQSLTQPHPRSRMVGEQ